MWRSGGCGGLRRIEGSPVVVLACGSCNGDEKRETAWRAFLSQKAGDKAAYRERESRILEWFALHPRPASRGSADVLRIREEIDELIATFGAKCAELKQALLSAAEDP
jgi:hypothetical protein